MNFKQRLWYILTRWDFINYMFCMTCLFVVVTGIQFWITDYMIQVMSLEQTEAYKLFFLIGSVGPVLGIVCAALLFDRIGGYTDERAVRWCGIVGFGGMICGMGSVAVDDNVINCAVLIMLELFCGAFVMPACTGIMLNQVPPKLRTMANSVANFSYNLFGYLPAPIMYGYFYEMGDSKQNHYGLLSIQLFTVLSFCGFTVAYFRHKYVIRKYQHVEDFSLINLEGEVIESKYSLLG